VGAAWLLATPPTSDMAAHSYRAWLFDHEGFAVWNAQWYGGHYVPGYSLLFPPLAGALGAFGAVVAAGLAACVALWTLARDVSRSTWAPWLAVSGGLTNLLIGRGPFVLGVALAALALLLWARGRRNWAAAAALACPLASPVAGVFLVVVALPRARLVVPAAVAGLALTQTFPEGGADRFVATAFWPLLALSVALVWLLPGRLRLPAAAGVALLVAAFVLPTPMGQNAGRLAVLAGPVAMAACGRGPRWALLAVGAGLVYLQWLPAVRALTEADRVDARPLVALLAGRAAPGDRVEVPLTRSHWEAADVAPARALARGWERQLDLKVNRLFYDGRLTPARYEAWLRREGIRWVALADAPLDVSARAEAALLRGGLPFLRAAGRAGSWRVWEVRGVAAEPIAAAGPQELVVDAPAGRTVMHRRWAAVWRVSSGRACVRSAGNRLAVEAPAAGRVVLKAALGGPRCRR
jgi:hypothetical protein